jgi:oligosaccharide repeat unit polymerase
MSIKLSRVFQIREQAELPFYCKPLWLFFAVWLLMLAAFQLRISYTSYPDISLALILFAISVASFMIGYATVSFAYSAVGRAPIGAIKYTIDITRLRRFQLAALTVSTSLLILNWKKYGLPPIFGFFGADTFLYGEYGVLKQLLFPAFMVLFVTAPLETSPVRRWFFYAFGPACALAYASRGYLLIMLFQILVVFSLRTTLSKKKLYFIALTTLCFAIILSDFIGNGRSSYGSSALLGYMQIKRAYYDWPTSYLWMISYISSPISNLCWIVRAYHYDHPSLFFLHSMLPGFLDSTSLEGGDLGSDNIVDGVHTYIAKYYLDLWWLGVFGINYIWGLISSYMSAGNRLTRNYLTSAVLLACIGFLFFADFISFLLILVELAMLAFGQKYFVREYIATDQQLATIHGS